MSTRLVVRINADTPPEQIEAALTALVSAMAAGGVTFDVPEFEVAP